MSCDVERMNVDNNKLKARCTHCHRIPHARAAGPHERSREIKRHRVSLDRRRAAVRSATKHSGKPPVEYAYPST